MLPKSVFHKKNGHAPPPAAPPATSAEMLRLVHSVREHAPRIGADLLRFAHVIRTERAAALFAQAAREVDGLRSAIAETLARTQQSLDTGRLEDVRTMLARLRDEADGVARLVAQLAVAAESGAGERRVIDVEDVIDRALELLLPGPQGATVVRTREPGLPPVAGHQRQLRQMLLALLASETAGSPGSVTIETSSREGAMRGERIVRVCIVDRRARAAPSEADVRAAAGIAGSHGGSLAVERAEDDGCGFIIDLPAL